MTHFRRRGRAFLLLVVASWSSACFAYANVGRLPEVGDLPADIRVFRYDGPYIELARSSIAHDTIRGFRAGSTTPLVIPMAYVDSLHYKKVEVTRTVVATALTVAGFAVLLSTIRGAQMPGGEPLLLP